LRSILIRQSGRNSPSIELRGAAMKAVELPDAREAMSHQGLDVETSTPQELLAPPTRKSCGAHLHNLQVRNSAESES